MRVRDFEGVGESTGEGEKVLRRSGEGEGG